MKDKIYISIIAILLISSTFAADPCDKTPDPIGGYARDIHKVDPYKDPPSTCDYTQINGALVLICE